MKSIFFYQTDIGMIGIAGTAHAVTHVYLPGDLPDPHMVREETALIKEAGRQLLNYFAGEQRDFTVPLAPAGTDFMRRVWQSLQTIPYGETRTYGEIARSIGNDRAYRAVGQANNRNPIAIFIPCHRVIGSNGKLVGYGGGLEIKSYLLELERVRREAGGSRIS
ncbi:MAG: methylated-DNA--[protein]-cysteine S-methyltransferase [Syntrophomonadaceae bacterium]|nr:methylated-DNA--[protein]-cysteine S-methyltransferase [Syntrophomonadaceae bacterium]